jgi:hypothetical protein
MNRTCLLCGAELGDISVTLVEWAQPLDGRRFDAIPRCEDHDACRLRLEAIGDPWPLAVSKKRSAA